MTASVLSPTTLSPITLSPTTPSQSQDCNDNVSSSGIGGTVRSFPWSWQGCTINITYETLGYGTPVLLIPALSMVSTRSEMGNLAQYLARRFQVITFDWPGFGDSDRPALEYSAPLYRQVLEDLLKELGKGPIALIAPGHAAAYALQLAQDCPELIAKVVTVAPTWKSPFTNAGLRNLLGGVVRRVVQTPLIGSLLYGLNSTPDFLRIRHARNAYVKPEHRSKEFLQQKQYITQKAGARHGAIAFVTGALDPVRNSSEFCQLFEQVNKPLLVIQGEQVPREFQEEMGTIATYPHLETQILPGSLALHEEFPAELAKAVTPFLTPPMLAATSPGRQWLGVSILGILLVTASLMAWMLNLA